MRRMVELYCAPCDYRTEAVCSESDVIRCPHCTTPMEQQWWQRGRRDATVWHPSEWATVFRKQDGSYSFPMTADKPTPAGCERITIKSDAEMARVEREAGVLSERRWFDRGSGHSAEKPLPPAPDMRGITIKARG